MQKQNPQLRLGLLPWAENFLYTAWALARCALRGSADPVQVRLWHLCDVRRKITHGRFRPESRSSRAESCPDLWVHGLIRMHVRLVAGL